MLMFPTLSRWFVLSGWLPVLQTSADVHLKVGLFLVKHFSHFELLLPLPTRERYVCRGHWISISKSLALHKDLLKQDGKEEKIVSFCQSYRLNSIQPPSLCRKEQAENEADLIEFRRLSQNVLQWEVKIQKEGRRDPRGSQLGPGHQKETLKSNWMAAAAQHILQCFEGLLKLLVKVNIIG